MLFYNNYYFSLCFRRDPGVGYFMHLQNGNNGLPRPEGVGSATKKQNITLLRQSGKKNWHRPFFDSTSRSYLCFFPPLAGSGSLIVVYTMADKQSPKSGSLFPQLCNNGCGRAGLGIFLPLYLDVIKIILYSH